MAAAATVKNRCVVCELSKQLDEIEVSRDLFRQTLTEQTNEPQKHSLIQQIDQWERQSIKKIQKAADEARKLLLRHTANHITNIEAKLAKLTDELRLNRNENDFVETDLNRWQEELSQLTKELAEPSNVSVEQGTISLVTNILVDVPTLNSVPTIAPNAKWIQNGTTVVGGNGAGNAFNQLNGPYSVYVDDDEQTIYVVDCSNDRVVEWKIAAASGRVVAGGNGRGNQANQLNHPTGIIVDKETDFLIICDYRNKRIVRWPRQNGTSGETIISGIGAWGLAMDSYGYLYVPDYDKHEVKRWKIGETNGIVVAGGNGSGDRLDQLNGPMYIFVDQDRSVYVSEYSNQRVMKWIEGAKEGIVVAGGQGAGNNLTQLHFPREVVVDQLGTVYVAEFYNHRVTRWPKGATQSSVVVGGIEAGAQPNQFNICIGLSFDRQCNLYVADYGNHRVQRFNIDPTSIQ